MESKNLKRTRRCKSELTCPPPNVAEKKAVRRPQVETHGRGELPRAALGGSLAPAVSVVTPSDTTAVPGPLKA